MTFEPQPAVTPALYRNLAVNCEDSRVVQLAASDRSGLGKMQVASSTGANTIADNGIDVPL